MVAERADQPAPAPATTLPAGSIVRLRLTQEVDSKHVKLGDILPLEVTCDVKIGDLVVIAKHTPVAATVSQVRRAPRGLRPGSLALEVKTINDINGNSIAVAATKSETGPRERGYVSHTHMLVPDIYLMLERPIAQAGTGESGLPILPSGARPRCTLTGSPHHLRTCADIMKWITNNS